MNTPDGGFGGGHPHFRLHTVIALKSSCLALETFLDLQGPFVQGQRVGGPFQVAVGAGRGLFSADGRARGGRVLGPSSVMRQRPLVQRQRVGGPAQSRGR